VDPDRPAAGSSFTLRLKVANRGEHFAENISLALSGDAFLPTDQGANLFWNSLDEGDDDEREVRLRAASGLTAGVYRLGIALRWDDSYGGSYTDSTSIGIEVSSGATRPVVAVTGSRLPERVVPGTPFTLALDLVNSGGREARNIVAVPLAGPLALVGAGGSPPLGLAPGAAATLVLQVMASEPSQPGGSDPDPRAAVRQPRRRKVHRQPGPWGAGGRRYGVRAHALGRLL